MLIGLTTAGLLASTGPASGQQRPCLEDLKKLCPDASPGTVEARACLTDHFADLSEACRKRVEALRARDRGKRRIPPHLRACRSDLETFCKSIRPGGRRLIRCLKEHAAELSAECKPVVAGTRSAPQAPTPAT
ncbi:MAG: hypothetical protein A3J75_04355 [Acidobacteria bacterium RBG_16_68_9]|nr:MAG: hypothetical protein A3J75_04355 [Acidobacteria bacterium RBG_16_68_9]